MKLRLGFHYHIPAYTDQDGYLYMPGYLGRFVDSLAVYCESVTCFLHSPLQDERSLLDYQIVSKNVKWVDLGSHSSLLIRMMRSSWIFHRVHKNVNEIDVMLIRGPSPLLPLIANAADGVPKALLLVGDYVAGLGDMKQPVWRMALIGAWAHRNKAEQLRVARKSLTFVNSHKLYQELRPQVHDLVETRTSTLSKKDFFFREDTCSTPPYHLLYTGRIDRGKGLLDIVEALSLLITWGENLVLDLVGWPEKGDDILEEVHNQASKLGIRDRVNYHGYKTLGDELFEFYKNSDIYVIASRSSEGFPRTIWEAMAHSLPVVATHVGSIPAFLDGAAVLVQPADTIALARAIQDLLRDKNKRQELIRRGVHLAQENTLEQQVSKMVRQIRDWYGCR